MDARSKPPRSGVNAMTLIAGSLLAVCLLSLIYCSYDLKFPNHFVGDMYGMEAMFRIIILLAASAPMILGILFLFIKREKQNSKLFSVGAILILVSASILLYLAIGIYNSRMQDDVRKGYNSMTVQELSKIVQIKGDLHAIYAIQAKNSDLAVSTLSDILQNENANLSCRMEAATSLGQIDGPKAKEALVAARENLKDPNILMAIDRALGSTSMH